MSEYQYYEFQAIDRPLTKSEMADLRSYSTRALITATSFVNEYSWGAFKGNEDAWMEKYFDAFLYFANWGTRIVKLALCANDGETSESLKFSLEGEGQPSWSCNTKIRRRTKPPGPARREAGGRP
jgi:hypothetical protein